MSLASRILGIPGLEVERVDSKKCIDVLAKTSKRPSRSYCGCDHLRIKSTDKCTVKHSQQGNRVVTLHLKAPKYHCQQCARYFRHRFAGIRPRFRTSETYRSIDRRYFPNATIVADRFHVVRLINHHFLKA